MAYLGGVEAPRREPTLEGQGLLQGPHRVVGAQVPEKAHDEARGEAQTNLAVHEGVSDARYRRLEGEAAARVGLRVEEDLGVSHALGGRLLQVGQGQLVEILLLQEHAHAFVVEVEKGLEVGEVVGPARLLDGGVGEGEAVAPGEV